MSKTILQEKYSHPRDKEIKFYSRGHKYEILCDKSSNYMSVTKWNGTHFPKFDADEIIAKMFKSKSWGPEHKYWGQTAEQIKASWKKNGDSATSSGTNLHERIEYFMNDDSFETEYTQQDLYKKYESIEKVHETQVEWEYFINFIKDHPELKPYRTEWMIFDEDLKLAGSIDMVYENPDGTLCIYDWKRSKEITAENNWNKYASNPLINSMPDTNFWHYALQLNTYKAILERKYGKTVTYLCLVRLHPDASNYELLPVPDLTEEIQLLFEEREKEK
jgi:hypothetical protein